MWLWVFFDIFLVAFARDDGLKYVKTIKSEFILVNCESLRYLKKVPNIIDLETYK